jgi:hypothetical protein
MNHSSNHSIRLSSFDLSVIATFIPAKGAALLSQFSFSGWTRHLDTSLRGILSAIDSYEVRIILLNLQGVWRIGPKAWGSLFDEAFREDRSLILLYNACDSILHTAQGLEVNSNAPLRKNEKLAIRTSDHEAIELIRSRRWEGIHPGGFVRSHDHEHVWEVSGV